MTIIIFMEIRTTEYGSHREFSAFVHGWGGPGNGTKACTIIPNPSGLELRVDGKQKLIQANQLHMNYGGSNNKIVIARVQPVAGETEYSIMIRDKKAIKAWRELNLSPAMSEALSALGKDGSGKARRLLVVSIVSLLVLVGGYFGIRAGYDLLVRSIADAIPADLQTQLGQISANEITSGGSLSKDEQANRLVKGLGSYLEERAEDHFGEDKFDFQFAVVSDERINAFALPGGFVFVNSGLIDAAGSVDELAGVLAHEIIHVTESHGVRNLIHQVGMAVAASVIIGDVEGIVSILIANGARLGNLAYGRRQESEADSLGLDIIYAAGFEPDGFVDFFHRLDETYDDGQTPPELFSTHPTTEGRIQKVEQMIQEKGQVDTLWSERTTYEALLESVQSNGIK